MDRREKVRIMARLYRATEEGFRDSCHANYYSDADNDIREYLKQAGEMKLTWGEFYDFCEHIVDCKKTKCIEEAQEGPFEIKLSRGKNGGGVRIERYDEAVPIPQEATISDLYATILSEEVRSIEQGDKMTRALPDERALGLTDFQEVYAYVSDFLRNG